MLWDLPFQALQPSAGHYLIEDAALSYAPSVTVLREAMRRRGDPRPPPDAAGVRQSRRADPLPETEQEVTARQVVRRVEPRLTSAPTRPRIAGRRKRRSIGVLHLATHGVVDNASPMYSHLALARPAPGDHEDGMLEAWEIMNMPLRADLVVLSACDTARGAGRSRRRARRLDVGGVRRRLAVDAGQRNGRWNPPAPRCSSVAFHQ